MPLEQQPLRENLPEHPQENQPRPLWGLIIVAVAVLPAVFLPVPAFGDFFYLPKVILLVIVEVLAALRLSSSARGFSRTGRNRGAGNPSAVSRRTANPLLLPLLVYWAVLVASTVTSIDPVLSITGGVFRWEGLIVFLLYGGLLILVPAAAAQGTATPDSPDASDADEVRIRVTERVDRLLFWGAAVAMAVVAYGVLQRYGLDPAPRDSIRSGAEWWRTSAFSTLGNSNFFGSFTAVYTALAAMRYLMIGRDAGPRWFWLAAVGIAYYGLMTSLSRGAWLAAGAALAFTLVVTLPAGLRPEGRRVLALAALFLVLTFAWRSADPLATGRVNAFVTDTTQGTGTVGQRLWMWRGTWAAVTARPVLGWGLDTLREVFPRFEPPGRVEANLAGWLIDRAHNDYLQVAVSSGLLGLAAYLWILWRGARSAWRVMAARAASPAARRLAAALSAGALAHLASMFMNISTISESPTFWGFLGAIAALSMYAGAETESQASGR